MRARLVAAPKCDEIMDSPFLSQSCARGTSGCAAGSGLLLRPFVGLSIALLRARATSQDSPSSEDDGDDDDDDACAAFAVAVAVVEEDNAAAAVADP